MILQRLSEFYDRLAADPATADALPKPGYSRQKVSFCVVLNPDGTLNGFQSMMETVGKKAVARQLLVPGQGKPSGSGINPCFLWDNSGYLLGYKPDDPKPERSRESFEAFRDRHLEAEPAVAAPAYAAVCRFLRDWRPERAADHAPALKDILGSFGVFRLAGEPGYVHDDPAVVAHWAGQVAAADAGGGTVRGLCLVTGHDDVIARLHEPKIKGVRDAQSSGALLVSFNGEAYTSYGKDQSYNAPVSAAAVFRYANALNYLLNRRDRRATVGDATVTFWSERPTKLEAVASEIFGESAPPPTDAPADDKAKAEEVKRFLSQLRLGHASGEAIDSENDVRFYVLGLSPNASRISVRFWLNSTVGRLTARLARHMADTELASTDTDESPLVIRRIVQATGRAEFSGGRFSGYAADTVSPQLAGAVARSVLDGTPYPPMLLVQTLNRLRSDRYFGHARLASVKAYLIRNKNKEQSVSLNVEHPSPAYHCGRLLCLLDYIQGQAIGNVNAGVVKKFYTVASCQPFAVFGRLIALTTKAHLPKLNSDDRPGFSDFCERLLRQIVSKIGDHFPRTLNLDEQGEFALGFYNEKEELPDTPPRNFSKTARGEQVRSRAEVTVADAMHALGVNYEYERPLSVPGYRLMKPDFTVLGKTPRDNVYVEYLGMSDVPEYMDRWKQKVEAYTAGGILPDGEGGGPFGRLVIITGTKTSGIDSADIRSTLHRIFNSNEE